MTKQYKVEKIKFCTKIFNLLVEYKIYLLLCLQMKCFKDFLF